MKKIIRVFINLLIVLTLCSCASKAQQIEKQLTLGNKYLIDLDYEQAILAFNKVIEIDPKITDAYNGLGEAYYKQAQAQTDYTAADPLYMNSSENYKTVLALISDGTGTTTSEKSLEVINNDVLGVLTELYGAWADMALKVGDTDRAVEILEEGYLILRDEELLKKSQAINVIKESGFGSTARPVSMAYFINGEENPLYTVVFEYDSAGNLVAGHYHRELRNRTRTGTYTYTYEGNILKTSEFVWNDGEFVGKEPNITTYECDASGRVLSSLEESEDDYSKCYTEVEFEYDENGRLIGGIVSGYSIDKESNDYYPTDGKYVYYYE
ncbi:tetratricopeptide repeat protein [Oribacterium sp. FC2011]|uniref:tetratricopeptide repeat protein n=1 Tax=Oribacterium sp. FC2011 TaxID=1408311 RepID=UPI0004E21C34|nr:tetratricopeptide repeat protein [Oribacterium sp. FC2011]